MLVKNSQYVIDQIVVAEYDHSHFWGSQDLHTDGAYMVIVILQILIVHDGLVVCSEAQSQALLEIITLKQFE